MTTVADAAGDVLELAVQDLLREHPHARTDLAVFRGEQFDRGLAWVGHPIGCGGLGLDPTRQAEIDQHLRAAGARPHPAVSVVALQLVVPTVMAYGSDAQRQRFLRPAFTSEEIWCQLFSEPGAGSDLASLATRAVRDGDAWRVTGQKVWTTMAHVAQWGLLLARTDPDAPKHRGITCFAVEMSAPGLEVRPLRQITGDTEYNEVFLDEVWLDDSMRVGPVDAGWKVALATLANERAAGEAFGGGAHGTGPIGRAVAQWNALDPADRDPVRRDRLARLWIEAEVTRLTAVRAAEQARRGRIDAAGSIGKVATALLHQRILDACVDTAGAGGMLIDSYERERTNSITLAGEDDGDVVRTFLAVQALSILGGTTEINKNLIAERVLGLPGDDRGDRDTPWSALRRA